MPVTASIKARVNLRYLKQMSDQIANTQIIDKAGSYAVEVLAYLRDKGFRIKMDTSEMTREYEITVFAGFNKGGKKLMTVNGYHLWAAVRSVIGHFLS
jgi:hypothetical protein